MSKGYGVDIYGIPFYGPEAPVNTSVAPSVSPFTATQADYGEITLQWAAPQNTPWKYLQLVRSVYGYPSTAQDGVLLAQFTPGTFQKTYDDAGLTPGTIYYYVIFATLEAPTWNSTTTYGIGTQVLYNGLYWTAQMVTLNNTPAAASPQWTANAYVPTWLPAGYAATLAMANEGYGNLLYTRAPEPYKVAGSDTLGNTAVDNQSLQNYFNVLGFGVDMLKNRYDTFLNINNPDVLSATDLDLLGQQFGINTDYMTTPQERRQRIKNATVNYQLKGEPQSIHNLVAELTGWDSTITEAANLLNSPDQSAAAHPLYDQWDQYHTYFPGQYVQTNSFLYKNLVIANGTAQQPTGTASSNTWWQYTPSLLDTTVSRNPMTNGFYTWGNASGATFQGVLTGLNLPFNATYPSFNQIVGNGFQFTYSGTAFSIVMASAFSTPAWSSGTNYVVNNMVTQGGVHYQAIKPSGPGTPYGSITPGTNSQFWTAFFLASGEVPNNTRDGAPLPITPTWNSTSTYTVGQRVQYNGIIYQAALTSTNKQPSGYYYSNASWIFVQAAGAGNGLADSGYMVILGTSAISNFVGVQPIWYDAHGNLVKNYSNKYGTTTSLPLTGVGFVARYIADYLDLNGTTEASIVNFTPGTVTNWASTPATAQLWRTSFGMASVNQTLAGTTTYVYSTLNISAQNGRFALTFSTDYTDTAHKTHGLLFAYQNSTNFWYATRQSLRKVVAGVDTQVLSWTRLNNGDRIVVDWQQTNQVDVYAYARDGLGTLNFLGTVAAASGPSTGSITGIIQKYSATGAL